MRKLAVLLLVTLTSWSQASPAIGARPAQGGDPAAVGARMIDTARSLLESFESSLRQQATYGFDSDTRLDWHYVPRERPGVPIGAMTEMQRQTTRALLHAALGEEGTEKAYGVIDVEEILYEQSGRRAMRDPGNYFVVFFGAPGASGPWGWRFEGHHLSLNFTLLDGRVVAASPAFFGANPAQAGDEGPHPGLRVLAAEEDLAFRLVRSFTGGAVERVIIAADTPDDIVTGNSSRAEMGAPDGVALADMDETQREVLIELLEVYLTRLHPDLAAVQRQRIREAGLPRIHFAWAGATEPGRPHYYRIHGPTFLAELDNTQNNANHIHSVWRDFAHDFGHDPLRAHLARDHGLKVAGLDTGAAEARHRDAHPSTTTPAGTDAGKHSHGALRHRH